jgi:RHS repeat-associated protein
MEGFSFKYDRLGRTIEKIHHDSKRLWRFQYNSEDQLTTVSTHFGMKIGRIHFKYDALGRRISKNDGTKETRFVWSMMRLLEEREKEHKSTYVYEQGSYVPLARVDGWNEEWLNAERRLVPKDLRGIYYFHNNASGQPEEVTDRDGTIVWRGRYNAWGQLLYEEAPQGFVQNLRMQGQYCDRETGLHYNTFRYYDSDIGRFTTEDPIGLLGGVNLYQYALNPIAWVDPWGWAADFQDHHVIPREYFRKNHPFLAKAGAQVNALENRIPLPTTPGGNPNNPNSSTHHGWNDAHKEYNRQIGDMLDDLDRQANAQGWDKTRSAQELADTQRQLKEDLKSGTRKCG